MWVLSIKLGEDKNKNWIDKCEFINYFLMSNNPFSKFVVDSSKVPDPNTITAREFENYAST